MSNVADSVVAVDVKAEQARAAVKDLVEMALAGAALYWAIYYAKPEVVTGMPAGVVEAYGRAQRVFGTTKPEPAPYTNPGDDSVNGSWST